MDTLAFLIKDAKNTSSDDSTSDIHEGLFLNVIHVEFSQSSELSGSFSRLVSTGPMYINRQDIFITDLTFMSFAGLPAITQLRQYRCTVLQWAGKIISATDDPNKIVVAIADAMTALNAAYVKCEIIQSNISNLATQYQETADGVKDFLEGFGHASCVGGSPVATKAEAPEMMLSQSTRSLKRRLDPQTLNKHKRVHAQGKYTFSRQYGGPALHYMRVG
ncbi:hypothetical protein GGF41_000878 [Coemansia sp. RSA 2531]|nr:hypothetical protein GGF41_000878 [Coemansia sp. RSA 2531]